MLDSFIRANKKYYPQTPDAHLVAGGRGGRGTGPLSFFDTVQIVSSNS